MLVSMSIIECLCCFCECSEKKGFFSIHCSYETCKPETVQASFVEVKRCSKPSF